MPQHSSRLLLNVIKLTRDFIGSGQPSGPDESLAQVLAQSFIFSNKSAYLSRKILHFNSFDYNPL